VQTEERTVAPHLNCYPRRHVQLKEGDRLGPYEVSAFIGAGGMGEVYRGRDPRLNRTVAIKVLPARDSVPFDLDKLTIEGAPKEILQPVLANMNMGSASYDIARNGTILYVPYRSAILNRHMVWADRTGKLETLPVNPRSSYRIPRLSPDGKKLLVVGEGANFDLWVSDLKRGTFSRLTFEEQNVLPVWSADSQSAIFTREFAGGAAVPMIVKADGSGRPRKLIDSPNPTFTSSASADGRWLATHEATPSNGWDIDIYSLTGDVKLHWKTVSPFNEWKPTLSPDSRWVAYESDESGRYEIYVQSAEGTGEKTLISTEGGREPLWSHSGNEIFYRSGDGFMSIPVSTANGFSASAPRFLFEHPFVFGEITRNYDATPDDQRFLFIEATSEEHQIRVIDVIVSVKPQP